MSASRPKLVRTVPQLRQTLAVVRREGKRIGLVPTMGALHEGHLSLVRASKTECDFTVVTIFVNPSQFGPNEDLDAYPRTLEADLDALAQCGVELVFAPAAEDVYRTGHATWVEVGSVAEPLEGECRPGHFRGVATIVLKLLNMVGADAAYFGQKDYQQAAVIRRMVGDLDVPTEISVCPTVREADGLAMSSRNAYLSPEARARALVLWKSLQRAVELVAQGERDTQRILQQMREIILTADDARIDYIALVDPDTLESVERVAGPTVAVLAVKIENTRLIDNFVLTP
ncbi:MAG TPA: pantoate--beta-alanine ligase [Thermoguttaceae bacterium]|nr:pantoate--beta-alanine ligase [Thermoguttaceae bacterium]